MSRLTKELLIELVNEASVAKNIEPPELKTNDQVVQFIDTALNYFNQLRDEIAVETHPKSK